MTADLRLALRSLRRQPALALAIVFTVGLAVAANTALFSIFDGLLFRPLPYPDADRLVHVEVPNDLRRLTAPQDLRDLSAALHESAVFDARAVAREAVLLEDGAADVAAWRLRPARVSPTLLPLLSVEPAVGSLLTGEPTGGAGAAMIAFDLWQARFGGDPAVIGRDVQVPGVILNQPLRIVGVMPRGFAFPDGANLWVTDVAVPLAGGFNVARLAEGVTVEQARAAFPDVVITPLRDHVRPEGAFALGVLLAATALLLLVAWVQVAALLFARAAARASELGIRLALGAGRLRIVRQFGAEGLLVAAAALVLAWIVTPGLTNAIVGLLPDTVTRGQALAPDARTFAFSMALSVVGVVLLTLLPIELVRRSTPVALLRDGVSGGVSRSAARSRMGLLTAQLAVTTMLLYMSGLAVHSFAAIGEVDLGFTPDDVVAVQLPPISAGGNPETVRAFIARQQAQREEAPRALLDLPGVRAVAVGPLPFYSTVLLGGEPGALTVDGVETPVLARSNRITRDYVQVMGLRLRDGRLPDEDEIAAASYALVNLALAREIAVHGPVVGQRITTGNRTAVVAGVIADFTLARPDRPVAPHAFLLVRAESSGFVLAKLDPQAAVAPTLAAMRETLDRVLPEHSSRDVMVVSDLARRAVADYRARAVLLALIGVLSLPLAFAGIAGALTDATAQRTREIGIRMALGAQPHDIRRRVLARGFAAVAAGVVAGLACGVAIGRAMSAFLFGVAAADAAAMIATAAVLVAIAWVALIVPARRAARVNPAEILR